MGQWAVELGRSCTSANTCSADQRGYTEGHACALGVVGGGGGQWSGSDRWNAPFSPESNGEGPPAVHRGSEDTPHVIDQGPFM